MQVVRNQKGVGLDIKTKQNNKTLDRVVEKSNLESFGASSILVQNDQIIQASETDTGGQEYTQDNLFGVHYLYL